MLPVSRLQATLCFLLCTLNVGSGLTALRGNENRSDGTELICHVSVVQMSAVDTHRDQASDVYHECSPVQDGEVSDASYLVDLPEELLENYQEEITRGDLFVAVPQGKIIDDDYIHVPDKSSIRVITTPENHQPRRLSTATGNRTVLVIRISGTSATPDFNASQIHGYIFDTDSFSVRSQYRSCSFGQLDFIPTEHGVIDVSVDVPVALGRTRQLVNAASAAAARDYGLTNLQAVADHTMFCLPPGTGNWAANANVNHWRSVHNNRWCGYQSGVMHELGHNLGLLHANDNGQPYLDYTGFMGAADAISHGPFKCFNAQNHWHLGWYQNRTLEFDLEGDSQIVDIAAFVDYEKVVDDDTEVVVKVGNDLYMQYNRAKGFNSETGERPDQLTVVRRVTGGTDLLVGLDAESPPYEIDDFQGTGETLTIGVCNVTLSANDTFPDFVSVSIGYGRSLCESHEYYYFCDDDLLATFDISWIHREKNCGWLADHPEWHSTVCVDGHAALAACPETCGECSDDCEDHPTGFFRDYGYYKRTCSWLFQNPDQRIFYCVPWSQANTLCRETCETCL